MRHQILPLRPPWILAALMAQVALVGRAGADGMPGSLEGVFRGNDSERALSLALGMRVEEVARVDWPSLAADGLGISALAMGEPGEAIAGEWICAGCGPLDLIVVKAGRHYAAYRIESGAGPPRLGGKWDTGALGDKGLSHLSAYRLVPEPSTAWLLTLGLGLLARCARRSSPG